MPTVQFLGSSLPNTDKDSGKFMHLMRAIRNADSTVILIHHVNKSGELKNSTTFKDYCDIVYEINKVEQNGKIVDVSLTNKKDRILVKKNLSSLLDFDKLKMTISEDTFDKKDYELCLAIVDILKEAGSSLNQKQIKEVLSDTISVRNEKFLEILKKYTDKIWQWEKGDNNSKVYSLT